MDSTLNVAVLKQRKAFNICYDLHGQQMLSWLAVDIQSWLTENVCFVSRGSVSCTVISFTPGQENLLTDYKSAEIG